MPDAPVPWPIPLELIRFKYPLPHLATALGGTEPVKIVAVGSSSTAGREDVVPYPCRLELEMRKRFFRRMIGVLNKGMGGEDAPDELKRFKRDAKALCGAILDAALPKPAV